MPFWQVLIVMVLPTGIVGGTAPGAHGNHLPPQGVSKTLAKPLSISTCATDALLAAASLQMFVVLSVTAVAFWQPVPGGGGGVGGAGVAGVSALKVL